MTTKHGHVHKRTKRVVVKAAICNTRYLVIYSSEQGIMLFASCTGDIMYIYIVLFIVIEAFVWFVKPIFYVSF